MTINSKSTRAQLIHAHKEAKEIIDALRSDIKVLRLHVQHGDIELRETEEKTHAASDVWERRLQTSTEELKNSRWDKVHLKEDIDWLEHLVDLQAKYITNTSEVREKGKNK